MPRLQSGFLDTSCWKQARHDAVEVDAAHFHIRAGMAGVDSIARMAVLSHATASQPPDTEAGGSKQLSRGKIWTRYAFQRSAPA